MKYRLYVDEVGNPDLKSSDNDEHRFLSLTGVAVELDYVSKILYPELEEIKKNYFGSHPDEPIIFHRKEIVKKKPPFIKLSDPEIAKSFNKTLIKKLESWEYSVISVIILEKDKFFRYKGTILGYGAKKLP